MINKNDFVESKTGNCSDSDNNDSGDDSDKEDTADKEPSTSSQVCRLCA